MDLLPWNTAQSHLPPSSTCTFFPWSWVNEFTRNLHLLYQLVFTAKWSTLHKRMLLYNFPGSNFVRVLSSLSLVSSKCSLHNIEFTHIFSTLVPAFFQNLCRLIKASLVLPRKPIKFHTETHFSFLSTTVNDTFIAWHYCKSGSTLPPRASVYNPSAPSSWLVDSNHERMRRIYF